MCKTRERAGGLGAPLRSQCVRVLHWVGCTQKQLIHGVVVQDILFPQGPGGKNNVRVVTRVLEKHIKTYKKVVL